MRRKCFTPRGLIAVLLVLPHLMLEKHAFGARTRSSKERDGERCRWRTRATSPYAPHSSKEREIHAMATCRVLTIRIDTNGAQRSASLAVFLDPAGSIPMIQITFPPVSAKFVRLSVNLPRRKLMVTSCVVSLEIFASAG
jgi:hypothetical protein